MSVDEDLQDTTLPPLQHIATSAKSHSSDLGVVRDVDIAFSFIDYLLHARSLVKRICCAQLIDSADAPSSYFSDAQGNPSKFWSTYDTFGEDAVGCACNLFGTCPNDTVKQIYVCLCIICI